MKREVQARIESIVRSEVARWKQSAPPFGASKAEIESFAARRDDYAARVFRALFVLQGEPDEILRAVGTALAEVRSRPWQTGIPEPGDLVERVRRLLTPDEKQAARRPVCADCEREGGVGFYLDSKLGPKQLAVVGPFPGGGGGRVARCSIHSERAIFEGVKKAFETQTPVDLGGAPFTPGMPPTPPTCCTKKGGGR